METKLFKFTHFDNQIHYCLYIRPFKEAPWEPISLTPNFDLAHATIEFNKMCAMEVDMIAHGTTPINTGLTAKESAN